MAFKRKIPARLRKYLSGEDMKKLADKNGIGERAVQKILKGENGDVHGLADQALQIIAKNKKSQTEQDKRFQEQLATL
jgi:Holliday junction resolvasome RuvABC DNA-binding subunit